MKVFEIKRLNGQYFTERNPFSSEAFLEWANYCGIPNNIILEPFAGSNNLIHMLQNMGLCNKFVSYDIHPKDDNVMFRDTIKNFPKGFNVCITNPPYLAQNSAKRRGLSYPINKYDDLYKLALDKCLSNCDSVAAIVPASFLNSRLFRERLSHYVLLNQKMFLETEHPVCLALFKNASNSVKVYEGNLFIGFLRDLERKIPQNKKSIEMRFNDNLGKLGLVAIDNTLEPSIRFCKGADINPDKVGVSSRSITRIAIEGNTTRLIKNLNEMLSSFREETHDVFLTPFKGLRRDNKYRRRLDYSLARTLINHVYFRI